MRFVTKICVVLHVIKRPKIFLGLVWSAREAKRRCVRVVPIIGGESGDKEFHRLGVYPIVVFTCFMIVYIYIYIYILDRILLLPNLIVYLC